MKLLKSILSAIWSFFWFKEKTKDELVTLLRQGFEGIQKFNKYCAKLKHKNHYRRGFLDLSGVDLSGVNLWCVDFSFVNLRGANLEGVCFQHADLYYTYFDGAILKNADLSYAVMVGASFRDADMAGVKITCLALIIETVGLPRSVFEQYINDLKKYIRFRD